MLEDQVIGSEDCLQLNIWTPVLVPEKPAPVMVWIHGGGHQQGGASMLQAGTRIYDGRRLAEKNGAVVVTISYRLGPLGYLALPELSGDHGSSGNLGTLDQIAALEWVQRNIASFGGDPTRVLIFGESAGGVSVCALIATPKAAGLFHAAIIQSAACTAKTLESAEAHARSLAAAAGCAENTAACLRTKTPEDLLRALPVDFNISTESTNYSSVVDGIIHPEGPLAAIAAGRHNRVPVIVGVNSDETARSVPNIATVAQYELLVRQQFGPLAPLVLRQYPANDYPTPRAAFVALSSDARFVCPSRRTAQTLWWAQHEPVYRYLFSYVPENAGAQLRAFGTWHGLDVLFLFDSLEGLAGYRPGERDQSIADTFAAYWGALAATGRPVPNGLPAWPVIGDAEAYLRISNPVTTGDGIRTLHCDFWDRLADLASR